RRDERPGDRGTPLLPAEVARRGAGAVRLLARPPRAEDARAAHAAALRERAGGRRAPERAPARRESPLTGPPGPSGPRAGREADAGLRRNGLVPRRVGGGGGRARRTDEDLDARGEPRRRREPDRAPCADDARG